MAMCLIGYDQHVSNTNQQHRRSLFKSGYGLVIVGSGLVSKVKYSKVNKWIYIALYL